MSRIGKLPIELPKGVEIKIDKNHVTVKGAKGSLTQTFDLDITVKVEDGKILEFCDERNNLNNCTKIKNFIQNK